MWPKRIIESKVTVLVLRIISIEKPRHIACHVHTKSTVQCCLSRVKGTHSNSNFYTHSKTIIKHQIVVIHKHIQISLSADHDWLILHRNWWSFCFCLFLCDLSQLVGYLTVFLTSALNRTYISSIFNLIKETSIFSMGHILNSECWIMIHPFSWSILTVMAPSMLIFKRVERTSSSLL